jgi:phosphate transport system protein
MPSEHTLRQFDEDLESIRAHVLEMGGLVEAQVNRALEALISGNINLAEQVIGDDHRVNALEVRIDEDCGHIIARRQPAAGDLRMIITVIKTITDLERIGDEATKIARSSKRIQQSDRIVTPKYSEIRYMGDLVLKMLRKALDAFARLEPAVAAQIGREDRDVDEEFRLITRHLITYMMEDPRTISTFIDILFIAKALERIGDHAKNMSEYVVYMVMGKDVRHTTLEEIEKEVL